MFNKDKYCIIGFNDHPDGEAYAHGKIWSARCLTLSLECALTLLASHDHVCITPLEIIKGQIEINTLKALAPYSLILEAGDKFPLSVNVNKL